MVRSEDIPTCPSCNGQVFERVLEETTIMQAAYIDGKLNVHTKDSAAHDSHVRCICGFTNFENPEEIEELFW